jgi:hypothetical protein
VRYVFGLLDNDSFGLYQDLHLMNLLSIFDKANITFVDLGMALFNEEKKEKYYFLKMVNNDEDEGRREVYLMAISVSQITKWDYSLSLKKQPSYIDKILRDVSESVLKQVEPLLRQSKQKVDQLREKAQSDITEQQRQHQSEDAKSASGFSHLLNQQSQQHEIEMRELKKVRAAMVKDQKT